MQQVSTTGSDPFSSLDAPQAVARTRSRAEVPPQPETFDRSRMQGQQQPVERDLGFGMTPRIKIFPQNNALCVRIDHPVRDLLVEIQKELSAFVKGGMRPTPIMGFNQVAREPVAVDGLLNALGAAHDKFEAISQERADGFGTSVTIRSTAAEAAAAVQHTLIDLVAAAGGPSVADTQVAGVLHGLVELRHGLGQLQQQFDVAMLDYVQQSGVLEKALGGGKKGAE